MQRLFLRITVSFWLERTSLRSFLTSLVLNHGPQQHISAFLKDLQGQGLPTTSQSTLESHGIQVLLSLYHSLSSNLNYCFGKEMFKVVPGCSLCKTLGLAWTEL